MDRTTTYVDLTPLVEAAVRGESLEIDPGLVTARDLPRLIRTGDDPAYVRTRVALLVWRFVAEFIHDVEPIRTVPGMTLAETAEQYVQEHATEAMCATDEANRIISQVLDKRGLLWAFLRMRRGEQAVASEGSN